MSKSTNLGNARTLGPVLRMLLAASTSSAIAIATVVACGGAVESGLPGCEVEGDVGDAGPCRTYRRKIVGEAAQCPTAPSSTECAQLCGQSVPSCYVSGLTTTYPEVWCGSGCAVDGRRPEGLVAPPRAGDDLGAHFAVMAYHEAAAAHAFAQLARELRAHRAPASLVRALRRAERDEVRHAAIASSLARRFGKEPLVPCVEAIAPRTLLDIALENAREGCGRELLGAAVGLHIAEAALDPVVRAAFAQIATDEVRHAAVSLRMQRWLRARLSAGERARVDAEMRAALHTGSTAGLPPQLSPPSDAEVARLGRAAHRRVEEYFADAA